MTCEWCNQPFTPHPFTPPGRQRFCSRRCQVMSLYHETRARRSEQRKEVR